MSYATRTGRRATALVW